MTDDPQPLNGPMRGLVYAVPLGIGLWLLIGLIVAVVVWL